MRPTLFLDCDGVLNPDLGPTGVLKRAELSLYQGAAAAIARVKQAGILAIGITNRSQVARGYVTEPELQDVLAGLQDMLALQGGALHSIFYCPHLPPPAEAGANLAFVKLCACRKPGTDLLRQAATAFPVDQGRAAMVGDSRRDIAAAHGFGLPGWGVRTGNACGGGTDAAGEPDLWFDSVVEAADHAVALWG